MKLEQNVSLKPYNTFGIEAKTAWFARVGSLEDLQWVFAQPEVANLPRLILGGGSNLLLTQDFPGLTIKIELLGKQRVASVGDTVLVKAGAGEVWHEFVLWSIAQGLGGIENLSLIPGCVGAAPMQNIGAYGVELKNVFYQLEAFFPETGEVRVFDGPTCAFGYRESIFKRELKGKCIIVSVTLKLSTSPTFNTSYGAIEQELKAMQVEQPTTEAISKAVINIRSSKLPNPAEIGNAGSFFKNPVIATAQYESLKEQFPDMVGYPAGPDKTKVAAGWLIEHAGWKGKTLGNYGVHKKQALVLVNYGGATGKEVYDLSEAIMNSVREQYGIQMEREVNIL